MTLIRELADVFEELVILSKVLGFPEGGEIDVVGRRVSGGLVTGEALEILVVALQDELVSDASRHSHAGGCNA
jgi:hypothetical protein